MVVIVEMEEEDRRGLFGQFGVRVEAGRKTPTFCKNPVLSGLPHVTLRKSLCGALKKVSKAWTHSTQRAACCLRSRAWRRLVHLGFHWVSAIPEGPCEQVVSLPNCSHHRDLKDTFGRGWSAG